MKIVSVNKKFKLIGYLFLIAVLALNLNSISFGKVQTENTQQNTPEVSSVVNQDEEKTIEEVKKEFREQNRESIDVFKVFSNLIALIIIMLVLAWLFNKYGKNFLSKAMSTRNANKNSINIISTMPIGQNKYLHIIEVDGERMLVGATNTNISLIKSLKNSLEEKVVSDE